MSHARGAVRQVEIDVKNPHAAPVPEQLGDRQDVAPPSDAPVVQWLNKSSADVWLMQLPDEHFTQVVLQTLVPSVSCVLSVIFTAVNELPLHR